MEIKRADDRLQRKCEAKAVRVDAQQTKKNQDLRETEAKLFMALRLASHFLLGAIP